MNVMLEKALSQRYVLPNIEVILSLKSQSVGNRSDDTSLKNSSPFVIYEPSNCIYDLIRLYFIVLITRLYK
jgi:hypothetical protein